MTSPQDRSPSPKLPPRDPHGHKGTFGTVLVVGGCDGSVRMTGAPALAARGALRSGAGLCKILAPLGVLQDAMSSLPSATGLVLPTRESILMAYEASAALDAAIEGASSIVIGPGLGGGPGIDALVLRTLQQQDVPVIVDADGINAMSRVPELFRDFHAAAILTPHPGEFKRLADSLRVASELSTDAGRAKAADALAQRLGCIVVLKGAGTVVSDGHQSWRCDASEPTLATAGTGDVLAGAIGGLVAQRAKRLMGEQLRGAMFTAACAAVHAHASAAAEWAKAHHASGGMLATELAELLPGQIEKLRG